MSVYCHHPFFSPILSLGLLTRAQKEMVTLKAVQPFLSLRKFHFSICFSAGGLPSASIPSARLADVKQGQDSVLLSRVL